MVSSQMLSLAIGRLVSLGISSGEGEAREEGCVNVLLLRLSSLLTPPSLFLSLFSGRVGFRCSEELSAAGGLNGEEYERDWEAV